jgi:hypothetical protein
MSAFNILNRSGLAMLADAETLIADRSGADSMYATDSGKLRACNKWVDHARPIILSMLVLDDEADGPLIRAVVDAGKDRRWRDPEPWQVRDYREARAEVAKARKALYDMLDGIRDNFISDERCGIGDTDAETEAADEFNDWLGEHTISVDQAVQIVNAEQNAAYDQRTGRLSGRCVTATIPAGFGTDAEPQVSGESARG